MAAHFLIMNLTSNPHDIRLKMESAATCLPHQTVRKLQGLLVESPINFVVLVNDDGGKILGIVTLHDLLRAEVEKAGSSDL